MMDTFPRGAQSFLEMDGTYNWTKPSGQLFFLKRARELGVEKIVAFSYSPHRRHTKNGLARASKPHTNMEGLFQLESLITCGQGRCQLDGGNADGNVIRFTNYKNNVKQTWYFFHVEADRYRIANAFWQDQCLYAADRTHLGALSLRQCSDTQDTTWLLNLVEYSGGFYSIRLDGTDLYLGIDVSTRGEARDETRWRCGAGGRRTDGRTDDIYF